MGNQADFECRRSEEVSIQSSGGAKVLRVELIILLTYMEIRIYLEEEIEAGQRFVNYYYNTPRHLELP
jgi:hypothetical protein